MERQTGKLVREVFDFVAGTSTGACLTALAQAGVPMKDVLPFYIGKIADHVFSPSGIVGTAKRIAKGYMYEPQVLYDALRDGMGKDYGMTLNKCPTGVLITAVAADGHTYFFVRDNEKNSKLTGSVNLLDAAVASSCAPTYHAPWQVPVGASDLWFFDGGAGGYASPGHQMCIEAFEYSTGFAPAETKAICLGTGYFRDPNVLPPKGILNTIGWAVSTLVDSSEDLSDQNARREYFRLFPDNYIKLDVQLPTDIAEDDLSAREDLLALGTREAAKVDWQRMLA